MPVYPRWPCISAVVNTYDRPEMLRRALDSIVAQDFADFEVLVIHDGPAAASTIETCRDYSKLIARFSFITTDENSGYQCVPKNAATWQARGDYVAYLDDDNEWSNDHLSTLLTALEEGEEWPDFVYGRREYVMDEGCDRKDLYVGVSPYVVWDEKAKERLAQGPVSNFIDTSDVLFAKGALWRMYLATGCMWNEAYRRFADWELMCRGVFFSGWKGKAVDAVVQKYHWHGKNVQLTRPAKESPRKIPA